MLAVSRVSIVINLMALHALASAARVEGEDCNQNGVPDGEDVAPRLASFAPPVDVVRVEGGSFQVEEVLDLDGDDRVDLLLHEYGSGTASIFSNRPGVEREGPLFELLSRWTLPDGVHHLTAVDLNRDGRPDLITGRRVISPGGIIIEVRFGRELGRFSDPGSYRLDGCGFYPLLHGDLDGDGDPDLTIPCNLLEVLLNRGNGILDPGQSGVAVPADFLADLDGDGDLDLAGIRRHFPGAGVALIGWNRGDGTFEETNAFPVSSSAALVMAADIDGDGHLDLAVHGDPLLVFFRNDGQGSFAEYRTHSEVYRPRFGDLDGNGSPDLVTARGEARVGLWWNSGDGSFTPPRNVPLSGPVAGAQIADLDEDGLGDVVTSQAVIQHADAVASVVFSRRRGASLDCDGNGVPDECTPPLDLDCRAYTLPHECAADCDFDGRSNACEIAAHEVPDCDENGVPDTCEVPGGVIADCNQDGISDYCQPELDCNRDGVGDACQDLYDGDRNGVPDECEDRGISFQVMFEAPENVRTGTGTVRIEATILLEQRGLVAGEESAAGWNLFAKAEGCDIVAATIAGTDFMEHADRGWYVVEVTSCRCPGGYTGAVTAAVLSLREPETFPPEESPHSILKVTLEGSPGTDGECAPCTLGLVEVDDCTRCHRGESFVNSVTYRRKNRPLPFSSRTLRFCAAEFHRGDANADGRLDISDPIVIFGHLFLGGTRPPCLEAADAQNDGRIELTDGIRLLEFLFRDGPPPAPPGRPGGPCGPDPEEPPGFFGCEEYAGC